MRVKHLQIAAVTGSALVLLGGCFKVAVEAYKADPQGFMQALSESSIERRTVRGHEYIKFYGEHTDFQHAADCPCHTDHNISPIEK